jgi:hypothetical protein
MRQMAADIISAQIGQFDSSCNVTTVRTPCMRDHGRHQPDTLIPGDLPKILAPKSNQTGRSNRFRRESSALI